MRTHFKPRSVIAVVFFAIIGISVYQSFSRIDAVQGGQTMALAIAENLLQSMVQTSTYQLIPDSIMTGFCWRNEDGSREGIFKDVNSGLAQWREQRWKISASETFMNTAADKATDYAYLSHHLKDVSFEATDFTMSEHVAKISGMLTIAQRKRSLRLDIDLAETGPAYEQQDLIALKATVEMSNDDFGSAMPVSAGQTVDLCITMQAARNLDIPDKSSGKPLLLSHYY